MTYALLIYRSRPATEPIPREHERMALDGHRALQADASSRGELHAVAQLADPGKARYVTRKGSSAHEITDGPYIETKEWLVGFYVIDCSDEAEALERARQICPDRSHAVEVRPVTWRWNP